jgi:hypothetical protein
VRTSVEVGRQIGIARGMSEFHCRPPPAAGC